MRRKCGETGLVWRVRSDADRKDFMKSVIFNLGETAGAEGKSMLFLRRDQARELLRSCASLRERLIVRYFMLNGLSPMELTTGRLENLDPVDCTLYLPRRHWKRNCLADIDAETVKLQILYAEDREEGPLVRSRRRRSLGKFGLWKAVKRIAMRTGIPGKGKVSPLVLKRTFAREWLISGGSVGSLQKQLSHKHLWSTAHYLRFVMDDVRPDHARMIRKLRTTETIEKTGEE